MSKAAMTTTARSKTRRGARGSSGRPEVDPIAEEPRPEATIDWLLQADAELARRVVLLDTPEMSEYLQRHLGQKLTAYLAGIKDAKAVGQWAQRRAQPSAITRERLRAGYHATALLSGAYGDRAAQGWFFGANATLDDRAPAAVLRDADTPDQIARIAPLARAFVRSAL